MLLTESADGSALVSLNQPAIRKLSVLLTFHATFTTFH